MSGRREVGRVRYPGQTVAAISTDRDILALLLTGLTTLAASLVVFRQGKSYSQTNHLYY
jgi:hypothetical protein